MALPWIFVSKNTNYKYQITNESQISIFNDQNLPGQDIVWIFEFWLLEFDCYLGFVIWDFNKAIKLQQSKSPLGTTKVWSSLRAVGWARIFACNLGLEFLISNIP